MQETTSLKRLRAVRSFTADPVPDAILEDILDVARWTGSASNRQAWQLIVITDRELLERLAEASETAKHLAGAALGIGIVMPGKTKIIDAYDEGRLAERVMLAAAAHGLGSSIGMFGGESRTEAQRLLGVPGEMTLRTVVSIGWPDELGRRRKATRGEARKPLSDLVHRNRWGQR
jgi:nitroreductase